MNTGASAASPPSGAAQVVLDNEAVQALADPDHRKHRRVLAVAEAVTGRARRGRAPSRLAIPTTVQVEAGWSPQTPTAARLNQFRAARPVLDPPAADAAARLVAELGVPAPDAHIGHLLARPETAAVLASDVDDMARIANHVHSRARVVAI